MIEYAFGTRTVNQENEAEVESTKRSRFTGWFVSTDEYMKDGFVDPVRLHLFWKIPSIESISTDKLVVLCAIHAHALQIRSYNE